MKVACSALHTRARVHLHVHTHTVHMHASSLCKMSLGWFGSMYKNSTDPYVLKQYTTVLFNLHIAMRGWFISVNVIVMNSCANVKSSYTKVINSPVKPTTAVMNSNSTANGTNKFDCKHLYITYV